MRELELIKKINISYRKLSLSYSKFFIALILMFITSILEMSSLSILYPLVLSLGGGNQPSRLHLFSSLPFSISLTPYHLILFLLTSVGVVYTIKNIILYFTYENNINFAIYYYRNLTRGLYTAFLNKPILELQKESSGSLAHMICVETGRLVDGVIRPLLVVTSEIFVLISISSLLFFISPGLIIVVIIACVGSAGLFYFLLRSPALVWGKKRMQFAARLQELVNCTMVGIKEIKIFNKEDYLTEKVQAAVYTETKMFHNLEMYQQAPRFIIETIFILTVVIFFLYLLMHGTSPSILLAQFSVIAAASFRILPSVNRLVNSYSNFSFNVGPATTLLDNIINFELLDNKKHLSDNETDNKEIHVNQIELDNVSFKYPTTERFVLNNVSLKINKGEKIGIAGSSGSGKSTLISIIAGLILPTLGNVKIDDQEISVLGKSWQKNIGYVPQESFIMSGTIRENITFGSDETNQDFAVWQVLEEVGLTKFISQLGKQLDTEIGEKGMLLSGGQKQLICLARALYRKPKILILDEPTASLDSQNEQVVLQAIDNLRLNSITIMVSHKHENFNHFDAIYNCIAGSLNKISNFRSAIS